MMRAAHPTQPLPRAPEPGGGRRGFRRPRHYLLCAMNSSRQRVMLPVVLALLAAGAILALALPGMDGGGNGAPGAERAGRAAPATAPALPATAPQFHRATPRPTRKPAVFPDQPVSTAGDQERDRRIPRASPLLSAARDPRRTARAAPRDQDPGTRRRPARRCRRPHPQRRRHLRARLLPRPHPRPLACQRPCHARVALRSRRVQPRQRRRRRRRQLDGRQSLIDKLSQGQ